MVLGPITLATTGLVAVLGAWGAYLATVPGGTVPARPLGHIAAQMAGIGLGVAGVVSAAGDGGATLLATIALSVPTVTMGSLFLYLLTQRKTPIGKLAVRVGDPLLSFSATDSEGDRFDSDSLRGQRVLLKIFRGHW